MTSSRKSNYKGDNKNTNNKNLNISNTHDKLLEQVNLLQKIDIMLV